jgi:Immunity protein 26
MGRKRNSREPGTFVVAPLGDGTFGYARLLQLPYVAFYRLRTTEQESSLDKIAESPVAFIVSANVDTWKAIGRRELEGELTKPVVMFRQDLADYRRCTIYDTIGNVPTCDAGGVRGTRALGGLGRRTRKRAASRPVRESTERGP